MAQTTIRSRWVFASPTHPGQEQHHESYEGDRRRHLHQHLQVPEREQRRMRRQRDARPAAECLQQRRQQGGSEVKLLGDATHRGVEKDPKCAQADPAPGREYGDQEQIHHRQDGETAPGERSGAQVAILRCEPGGEQRPDTQQSGQENPSPAPKTPPGSRAKYSVYGNQTSSETPRALRKLIYGLRNARFLPRTCMTLASPFTSPPSDTLLASPSPWPCEYPEHPEAARRA